MSDNDLPIIRKLSERTSRAKKDLRCGICNGTIPAGTIYHRFSYIDEDALPSPKFNCVPYHAKCPEPDHMISPTGEWVPKPGAGR